MGSRDGNGGDGKLVKKRLNRLAIVPVGDNPRSSEGKRIMEQPTTAVAETVRATLSSFGVNLLTLESELWHHYNHAIRDAQECASQAESRPDSVYWPKAAERAEGRETKARDTWKAVKALLAMSEGKTGSVSRVDNSLLGVVAEGWNKSGLKPMVR